MCPDKNVTIVLFSMLIFRVTSWLSGLDAAGARNNLAVFLFFIV